MFCTQSTSLIACVDHHSVGSDGDPGRSTLRLYASAGRVAQLSSSAVHRPIVSTRPLSLHPCYLGPIPTWIFELLRKR
ncbi:unnamed protein product [Strongylus vulgaris]|uniref:Uncharacterized protein n=1 Tax=Strongylus vulgaris TaxID=40348 RepID=A0A3P7JZU7_STRVU|nr:unnamed protein product [Strongylus vulgaris]